MIVRLEYPLAYFLTWTTYGTWLPGDERGWRKRGSLLVQEPDPRLRAASTRLMKEDPVILTNVQRQLVDSVFVRHCEIRGWSLHARNVRTNHIHAVVSAECDGKIVRAQLKSWCTRELSDTAGLVGAGKNGRRRWFSERGDVEWIETEEHLRDAIQYVNELQ